MSAPSGPDPLANPAAESIGPSSTDEFIKGLWRENPVFVTVLGMCPTLAVSNSAKNALAMGLATTVVLGMSGAAISAVRKWVPSEVRIATFILIIASFVTAVEYALQAFSLELHKALGAFIALIVVNCQILGRAEAFASKNKVLPSLMDGLGVQMTLRDPAVSREEMLAVVVATAEAMLGAKLQDAASAAVPA